MEESSRRSEAHPPVPSSVPAFLLRSRLPPSSLSGNPSSQRDASQINAFPLTLAHLQIFLSSLPQPLSFVFSSVPSRRELLPFDLLSFARPTSRQRRFLDELLLATRKAEGCLLRYTSAKRELPSILLYFKETEEEEGGEMGGQRGEEKEGREIVFSTTTL